MKKVAIVLLIGVFCMSLFGCEKKTYSVDYHGQQDLFVGAEMSYKEGTKVKLKYDLIATDTDYTFYVDGERFNPEWKNGAFYIEFKMPNHNIEVYCDSRNTMVR